MVNVTDEFGKSINLSNWDNVKDLLVLDVASIVDAQIYKGCLCQTDNDINVLTGITACVYNDGAEIRLAIPETSLQEWGKTFREVREVAEKNLIEKGILITPIDAFVEPIIDTSEPFNEEPTTFVVNSPLGGAAVAFTEEGKRQIYEKIGGKTFIIPSSRWEVLITSTDNLTPEYATEMLKAVNSTLDSWDMLSDKVMVLDETLTITSADKAFA